MQIGFTHEYKNFLSTNLLMSDSNFIKGQFQLQNITEEHKCFRHKPFSVNGYIGYQVKNGGTIWSVSPPVLFAAGEVVRLGLA